MLAVGIRQLVKDYPIFRKPSEGLSYLWSAAVGGGARLPAGGRRVRALDHVDLAVGKGERVGIIGRNGAGKSTLLKLLIGGFAPTAGTLTLDGEVYGLLPGAVSFSPDLSTRDNATNHLKMHGLDDTAIAKRIDEIMDFTELGEYFEQPVKNYSLGMRVRAEFAVATAVHADIIIIDEVLGAGDIYWTAKIAARMDALCSGGATLMLVSHSLDQITRFCERTVWIERGQVVMDGPTDDVARRYESFLEHLSWQTEDLDDASSALERSLHDIGDAALPESGQSVIRWPGRGDAMVTGLWLNGGPVSSLAIKSDEDLDIRISTTAQRSGRISLRHTITFWTEGGKRAAVIENEGEVWDAAAGERHGATVRVPAGRILGRYLLTVSVFDLGQRGSNERSSRLDLIYKSFAVDFANAFAPVYRIMLNVEKG